MCLGVLKRFPRYCYQYSRSGICFFQHGTFNWDSQTQGYILGAFFYGYTVTQIISGMIADKFGGKLLMLFGLSWFSLLTLLTPIVTVVGGFGALFTVRVLEGMGSVCNSVM